MADYRTEFSVLLPLWSQEESDAALKIYHEHEERSQHDDDAVGIGFNAEQMFGSTDLCLWSGGDGDTEQVIAYVRDCAKALGLTGRLGFQWVSTCSRPRPDGFDSGVIVLDLATGETLDWMSGQQWLAAHLVTSAPSFGADALVPAKRLDVRPLSTDDGRGFELVRADCEPPIVVATIHDGIDRGIGEAEAIARLLSAAPQMRSVLQEALRAWSAQFDGDPQQDLSISGADLVDWFSQWRRRARAALAMASVLIP